MTHPPIREQEPLAQHTTLGLGGPARFFADCSTAEDVCAAIAYARERTLPLLILGGGSNLVVPDTGFPGVVLHLMSRGMECALNGQRADVRVAGGEPWDDVVMECIRRNLGGLECLAGIPGTAGATPVQNVGAYGQEVAECITAVYAIDIDTLRPVRFSGGECGFHYRGSRFKEADAGKFVILEVEFSLAVTTRAVIRYPELARAIERDAARAGIPAGTVTLEQARASVVRLRKSKGMVLDPDDPDSRSAGSFFTNPLVTDQDLAAICRRWADAGHDEPVPVFPAAGMHKLPAGWLVERAGFPRGLRRGGAGISTKHALALVNYGGSTGDLLALASDIQAGVLSAFNVKLEMEPVLAGAEPWRQRHG